MERISNMGRGLSLRFVHGRVYVLLGGGYKEIPVRECKGMFTGGPDHIC